MAIKITSRGGKPLAKPITVDAKSNEYKIGWNLVPTSGKMTFSGTERNPQDEKLKGLEVQQKEATLTKTQAEAKGIKAKPAETAGKVGGAKYALTRLPELETMLFNNKGEIDPKTAAEIWYKAPTDNSSIGNEILYNAIDAIVRFKTGATATQQEMDNARGAFAPRPWDSNKAVKNKLDAMRNLLGTIIGEAEGSRNQPSKTPQKKAVNVGGVKFEITGE